MQELHVGQIRVPIEDAWAHVIDLHLSPVQARARRCMPIASARRAPGDTILNARSCRERHHDGMKCGGALPSSWTVRAYAGRGSVWCREPANSLLRVLSHPHVEGVVQEEIGEQR